MGTEFTKKKVEKLYKAAIELQAPHTEQEAQKVVVREAMKLFDAKFGSIFLPEKTGGLKRAYASDKILYTISPRKRGLTYRAFKEKKGYIKASNILEKFHPKLGQFKIGYDMTVPLFYKNNVIGVISLLSHPDKKFSSQDLEILEFYSPLATLTLERTRAFDSTLEAISLRDLFISMAAHELKTPLTSLRLYNQLMQRMLDEGKRINKKILQQEKHSIERIIKLIDAMLRLEQMQKGKMHYAKKSHRLSTIIKTALDDFSMAYNNKVDFVYRKNIDDKIKGNFDKLIQVFLNVLTNAAKFSPANSSLKITMAKKGGKLHILIIDKGQGIHKRDKNHIFEQFYKGSDHTKEGMGIGLFLVKEILENHKGTIGIKETSDKGTTFEIIL